MLCLVELSAQRLRSRVFPKNCVPFSSNRGRENEESVQVELEDVARLLREQLEYPFARIALEVTLAFSDHKVAPKTNRKSYEKNLYQLKARKRQNSLLQQMEKSEEEKNSEWNQATRLCHQCERGGDESPKIVALLLLFPPQEGLPEGDHREE